MGSAERNSRDNRDYFLILEFLYLEDRENRDGRDSRENRKDRENKDNRVNRGDRVDEARVSQPHYPYLPYLPYFPYKFHLNRCTNFSSEVPRFANKSKLHWKGVYSAYISFQGNELGGEDWCLSREIFLVRRVAERVIKGQKGLKGLYFLLFGPFGPFGLF